MMHKNRSFGVAQIEDAGELANKLQAYDWTTCTAFQIRRYIFANDSTGPDGAQEYAVLVEDGPDTLRQIESITFGWCDPARALEHVENVLAGLYDSEAYATVPRARFQSPHPTCHACA